MENKEQKEFYLMVKGQKVVVSEEIYRAYKRPVRAEKKRQQRERRCVIEKIVDGKTSWVRCEGNCSACEKDKRDRTSFVYSYDLMVDDGFDMADRTADIEEEIVNRELVGDLREAIKTLNENQQKIIKAVYFENLSQTEVAKRLGITKVTVNRYLLRIHNHLKNLLKN